MSDMNTANLEDDSLLSADWMFSRTTEFVLNSRDVVKLHSLSETAAKAVFRLRSLRICGVGKLLANIQDESATEDEIRQSKSSAVQRRDWLQKKLGLDRHSSPWTRRLNHDPRNSLWKVDHLFRLAALVQVDDPAPVTLEWATMLTWLVLEKGQIHSTGVLPDSLLMYSAAALEAAERFSGNDSPAPPPPMTAWIPAAQRRIVRYIERADSLVSPEDRRKLGVHARHEQHAFAAVILNVSGKLRTIISESGVNHA